MPVYRHPQKGLKVDRETVIKCHIARQPIFIRRKQLFGYELLFRHGNASSCPDVDGALAAAQVLYKSILSDGFENLPHETRPC